MSRTYRKKYGLEDWKKYFSGFSNKFHRDGFSVGNKLHGSGSKNLKHQTNYTRRSQERKQKYKILYSYKYENEDWLCLEKKYKGFVWNWD